MSNSAEALSTRDDSHSNARGMNTRIYPNPNKSDNRIIEGEKKSQESLSEKPRYAEVPIFVQTPLA
jgi:hypothetical protein